MYPPGVRESWGFPQLPPQGPCPVRNPREAQEGIEPESHPPAIPGVGRSEPAREKQSGLQAILSLWKSVSGPVLAADLRVPAERGKWSAALPLVAAAPTKRIKIISSPFNFHPPPPPFPGDAGLFDPQLGRGRPWPGWEALWSPCWPLQEEH